MLGRLLGAVDEGKALLAEVRAQIAGDASADGLPIELTRDVSPRLFVLRNGKVRVSTWHSDGLAQYAGIEVDDYLVLCALLGLVQLRAIERNESLIEEDCWHISPADCLFGLAPRKQDYATLLEHLQICEGCLEFYTQLNAPVELTALEAHLRTLRKGDAG